MRNKKPHHIGTLSPEMALLGLLYRESGHGYDLHRKIGADLGQVWHLSQSQAYSTLKRLEMRGEISVQEIPQEKLPPRQLLHMTAQGRKNFLEWLDTPSGGSTRAIRMEFITRLYFMNIYFPERITHEEGASMFGQELAELTQGLNESLPQFDGGDWEILSHNINFTGLVAMISFLIRRPARLHETGRSV